MDVSPFLSPYLTSPGQPPLAPIQLEVSLQHPPEGQRNITSAQSSQAYQAAVAQLQQAQGHLNNLRNQHARHQQAPVSPLAERNSMPTLSLMA